MLMTIPTERLKATDNPVVVFRETARGEPEAVQSWFYPGERMGQEFVYSAAQTKRIAELRRSSAASASKTASRSKGRTLRKVAATRAGIASSK